MKYDEFAFFNQQLASMLKDGIPLEGALRQVCTGMRHDPLRRQMEALEADLAGGIPLDKALTARNLPFFYTEMVKVGVKSNNLPGVLTLLADYYHRLHSVWTRLKGVMVYPAIVLVVALVFSVVLGLVLGPLGRTVIEKFDAWATPSAPVLTQRVLIPPIIVTVLAAGAIAVVAVPGLRRWFSWRVAPFRWANLARTASAMSVLLRGGCSLSDALGLMREMEADTPAEREFERWQDNLAAGQPGMVGIRSSTFFPRLFIWLVEHSGEDPASGFERAARMYEERAVHGIDMLLYGALPVSILFLGCMVLAQAGAVVAVLVDLMSLMGQMGA